METYKIIIWSFYIGICFALLYAYYVKHVVGSIVRYLIEKECFSKEDAKPLPGFKAFDSVMIRFALRQRSFVYDTVSVFEANGEKLYFIQEEKTEKAKIRYKNDIKLYHVVIGAALLFAFAVLISYYYNDIMKLVMKFSNGL